jgi:hypothetical protein
MFTISTMFAVAFTFATPVSADWDPGDPFKMHAPQLPDPNGWDVSFLNGPLGDDWLCTETGPVNDIHLWLSFRGDFEPGPEAVLTGVVEIWSDVPADLDPVMPWSHPGDLLWDMPFDTNQPNVTLRRYGTGEEGWIEPPDQFILNDHKTYHQLNIDPIIDVTAPFKQERGQIYWLVVHMVADDPTAPGELQVGWKTSLDQYRDDAVYTNPLGLPQWMPLEDPLTGVSLDLAFVITPEPATLALMTLGGFAVLRRR